jgi:hypothetical protein
MPLFRKSTSQADELARRRRPSLGRKELDQAVRVVVDEAGLPARRLKDGWMVEFDSDVHIALRSFHREGVVAGCDDRRRGPWGRAHAPAARLQPPAPPLLLHR